jgi:hypothetical protein
MSPPETDTAETDTAETDTRKPVVRNLRFPVAMWDLLRMMAATDRRSINWLIVDLLREALDLRDEQTESTQP